MVSKSNISSFMCPKKLSCGVLSQQLPFLNIDCLNFLSLIKRIKLMFISDSLDLNELMFLCKAQFDDFLPVYLLFPEQNLIPVNHLGHTIIFALYKHPELWINKQICYCTKYKYICKQYFSRDIFCKFTVKKIFSYSVVSRSGHACYIAKHSDI